VSLAIWLAKSSLLSANDSILGRLVHMFIVIIDRSQNNCIFNSHHPIVEL